MRFALAPERGPCHPEGVVLPLVPFLLGRVTCIHCGKDEVRMRAELKVGAKRTCPHCGQTYRVTEVRGVASRKRAPAKPASKTPAKPASKIGKSSK